MKKITKKLSLNKVNLTELDKNQMNNVRGGEGDINVDGSGVTYCSRGNCSGGSYASVACTQKSCQPQ
jgi:natural product precursor